MGYNQDLWYRKNRKTLIENRKKERAIVLAHYGGDPPKCSCCQTDIFEFLAVDHIKGRTTGNVTDKMSGTFLCRELIKQGFPEGFQVLCYNCNMAKGLYGKCPHKEMEKLNEEYNQLIQEYNSMISLSKRESEKTTETSTNLPIQ